MAPTPRTASSQVSWALLTEGVTAARVDLHRVKLMIERASRLVEDSEKREHLYQVAGDLIMGLPKSLAAAELNLDRTAYALALMGKEFLRGRIPLSDRARVEEAEATAPYSSPERSKESEAARRVASRYEAKRAQFRAYFEQDLGDPRWILQGEGGTSWEAGAFILRRPAGDMFVITTAPEAGYDRPTGYRVEHLYVTPTGTRLVAQGGCAAEDLQAYLRGMAAVTAGLRKEASDAHHFHDNPQKRSVRDFARAEATANDPDTAAAAARAAENPVEGPGAARANARGAPPTPDRVVRKPGGREFGTLNRFIVETDEPVKGRVPRSRDELPRHPAPRGGRL